MPADSPEPAEAIEISLTAACLRDAVAALPERERTVIELRYGLGGAQPLTVEETRKRLHLRRADVIELEERALERLAMERELQALREAAQASATRRLSGGGLRPERAETPRDVRR